MTQLLGDLAVKSLIAEEESEAASNGSVLGAPLIPELYHGLYMNSSRTIRRSEQPPPRRPRPAFVRQGVL